MEKLPDTLRNTASCPSVKRKTPFMGEIPSPALPLLQIPKPASFRHSAIKNFQPP